MAADNLVPAATAGEPAEAGSWLYNLDTRIEPRQASNLLLWLIAGFFFIALIWAAFTELDRAVRGQGRIVPGPQIQTVSNLEGGVVADIHAEVGEEVEAGAPLVTLDQTQSSAALGSNRAQGDALAIKVERLRAEIRGESPTFPPTTSGDMAQQVAIELALHRSRMAELASQLESARARIAQAERAVAEARANHAAHVAAREGAHAEVDALRPLVERGIEPRLSLTQAEARLSAATHQAEASAAGISRALSQVSEARSDFMRQRQQWQARAADELAAVQAESSVLERTIPALADRLERTVVRAPLRGTINRVLVSTIGGAVAPGAPLVEIVPSGEELVIEAAIRPSDIAQVRIGQDAKIELTAYDARTHGYLDGKVLTISPDTTLDERTGLRHYIVRIAAVPPVDAKGNAQMELGSGMVVNVMLLGEEQSVLDYILTPITRLRENAFRE